MRFPVMFVALALALPACQPPAKNQPVANAPTASWVHRAPVASDDTGNAFVTNAAGITMSVDCGNSGIASVNLSPDPRPADLRWIDKAVLFLSVDGGRQMQIPATCGAYGCSQDPMLGGEPFPVRDIRRIISALRAGSNVDVYLNGQSIQSFTLAGSSRALAAYKADQGQYCEGL